MARLNRGETTKLSIKLSADAKANILRASKNLNLSQAGVIMFALSHILKNPPSKTDLINWENEIVFEPGNFPITLKKELSRTIDALQQEHDMPKNRLVGLIVSKTFTTFNESFEAWNTLMEEHDATPKKINVQLNTELKKKIVEFSDINYVSMSGIISAAILLGPHKGFPHYDSNESDSFFTNIPMYIYNKVETESDLLGIPEHFYVGLCCYKAFSEKNTIFELE